MSLGLNRGEVASSLVVSEVSQMMIAWGGGVSHDLVTVAPGHFYI